MTLPNFLVIGASKSGTTSLYYYLQQHPDVYMSPVKEPKFFAFEGQEVYFRGAGIQRRVTSGLTTDIEEYRALFEGAEGEKAIGEASTLYLYSPRAPGRIKHHVPEAKMVALLRNPVDRAYSAYARQVRARREPLSFSEALREEERRIQDGWYHVYHYKNRGLYHGQLKRYFELFDRERIKVCLYEELNEDPVGVSQDVFRFLGVDDAFEPDTSLRHNVSGGIPKSEALAALIDTPNLLKTLAKSVLPERLRKRVLAELKNRNFKRVPPLPEEARSEVIEVFREDVFKLQELLGRDLSGWLDGGRRGVHDAA
jgi:hypothetical protein